MSIQLGRFRWDRIFVLLSISALIIFYGFHYASKSKSVVVNGIYLTEPRLIQDFQLTTQTGKSFTKNNLQGHWTMMFFGFTNCGMVCPTTLAALNDMVDVLQKDLPAKQIPQIVFVSIDPERDSQNKIKNYMNAFNSHFIGLRGSITQTIALENQLHIVINKMRLDDKAQDHYTINHSTEILLFNPNGQLQAYFAYPHQAEQLVKDYKSIMAVSSCVG